jgi:nicotinamidase-related amidase
VDGLTEPDWASAALLTIDVQVDTLDGQPLEIPGTTAAVPAIADLCHAFRSAGSPIVHVVRLYLADGSNAELCRKDLVRASGSLLRPDTCGRCLAPGILPPEAPELDDHLLLAGGFQDLAPNEFAMYKPRWGAFFGTALDAFLMDRGVTTLVFAGCNFPNCPRTSIYEASERDYRTVLVEDAVSGLYERGREELAKIGVRLLPVVSVRRELAMAHAM